MLEIQTPYVFADAFGQMAESNGNVLASPVKSCRVAVGGRAMFVSSKTGSVLAVGEIIKVRPGWVDVRVEQVHV